MSEPIVFVSHFRIKEGQLEALRRMSADSTERLRAQKPRTVLFLSYIDEEQGVVSFIHAFEDADAMDLHFEGADERSKAAYELIEPIGWEFYGRGSPAALESMRQAAASTGGALSVQPEYLAGFLRLASAPA